MKKILVSGCANCPYLRVFDDGEDNGIKSISHGECHHPSFKIHKALPAAMMIRSVFLEFDHTKDDDPVSNVKAYGVPHWCPLPNEPVIYSPTCISID